MQTAGEREENRQSEGNEGNRVEHQRVLHERDVFLMRKNSMVFLLYSGRVKAVAVFSGFQIWPIDRLLSFSCRRTRD